MYFIFDEFDALCSGEGTIIQQLLSELDGIEELVGVSVLAATNRIERIDPACLRPGRFDSILELRLPNEEERKHNLQYI